MKVWEGPIGAEIKQALVEKYLVLTSHVSSPWTYQYNAKRFAALPPTAQAAMRKAADRSAEWFNKYVFNEEEHFAKQLEAKGMTVIRPDLEPFRERAKEVVKQFPEPQPWHAKIVAQ